MCLIELQFYVDTVKKMAHQQFVSGSPLRTLCLLIAGQPADVFSAGSSSSSLSGAANIYQQPTEVIYLLEQSVADFACNIYCFCYSVIHAFQIIWISCSTESSAWVTFWAIAT